MMTLGHGDLSWLQVVEYFGPRIFYAIVAGGLIGLERELKNKPAGIKTNILICIGSTLYTAISILISGAHASSGHYGDPARVAAQIVSGIGFLGGGTIIQARGTILGLTTAATIWVVAAIGVAIGMGFLNVGVACAILVVGVLVGTNLFEDRILGRSLTFACDIVVEDPQGAVRQGINDALSRNSLSLDDFDLRSTGSGSQSVLALKYSGSRSDHKKFILDLWSTPGIIEVKQV